MKSSLAGAGLLMFTLGILLLLGGVLGELVYSTSTMGLIRRRALVLSPRAIAVPVGEKKLHMSQQSTVDE
jgi:hypothetical protein